MTRHGLSDLSQYEKKEDTNLEISDVNLRAANNKIKVTEDQLVTFLQLCREKYLRAKIEPGKR